MKLSDEQGWKVAQNVATGVVGLVIWPVWFGMPLRFHKLQPCHGLRRDLLRAGSCQISGRGAERATEPLQEPRLVGGQHHLVADTAYDGAWIKRRLAETRILTRRPREGGGEYSLIVERPWRRIGREEDVFDDGRQRDARIEQR